jgi:hypothetical protein
MAAKQTTKIMSSITVGNPVRNIEPKTIAAVILVAVMAVLWVRVLFRSGADTASAGTAKANVEQMQAENVEPEIKIRAIPLAMIAGRHDTIASDFFRADRCSVWNQNAAPVATPSANLGESQRLFNEMVKTLTLEAIIKNTQGNAEKASINGTLVTVGSLLQVKVRTETYSVRVVAIEPGRVQLSWQDRSVAIEMPDQKMN